MWVGGQPEPSPAVYDMPSWTNGIYLPEKLDVILFPEFIK
jgi:hypothetical protein